MCQLYVHESISRNDAAESNRTIHVRHTEVHEAVLNNDYKNVITINCAIKICNHTILEKTLSQK